MCVLEDSQGEATKKEGIYNNNNNNTEKPYMGYSGIPLVKDKWGRLKTSFYVNKDFEQTFKQFIKLCRQDELSYSRVICRLIRTWMDAHREGQPQLTLTGEHFKPPFQYSLIPVEKRRQLMQDLLDTINKNPKVSIRAIVAAFSVESGLREETVVEYVRTLKRARKLRRGK